MKVALTGATGFIGQPLVAHLHALGHECTVLSRDPARARALFSTAVAFAPLDQLPTCDAVIHLAGESVVGLWTPWKRRAILRSRVDGTRRLVRRFRELRSPPRILLSASAIGIYGHRPGEELTEAAAPDPRDRFRAQVCRAWETAAREAEAHGVRVTTLRLGNVMDPGGGFLGGLLPVYRRLGGFVFGAPDSEVAWISLIDAVRLIGFVLENDALRGPLNVVAPAPVSRRSLAHTLASRLGVKVRGRIPEAAMRVLLGEFSAALLDDQHVIPQRANEAGFHFTHPAWRSWLDATFDTADGVLPR